MVRCDEMATITTMGRIDRNGQCNNNINDNNHNHNNNGRKKARKEGRKEGRGKQLARQTGRQYINIYMLYELFAVSNKHYSQRQTSTLVYLNTGVISFLSSQGASGGEDCHHRVTLNG